MLKAFHNCFQLGLLLASQRDEAARPDGEEERASTARKYRAELLKKLTEAERGLTASWGPEAAGAARRMVTIWLDEILIQAPWPGQKPWLHKPLQSEWGEGRSGGLWFFQRLESLNPARRDDRELAALALRCISLDLRGCYGRDLMRLDQIRREVQERFGFTDYTPIFPPPLPPGDSHKAGAGSFGLKLAAALAAVLLLVWWAGSFSLERTLRAVKAETEFFSIPAPAARPFEAL